MGLLSKRKTIVNFGTSNIQGSLDTRKRWLIATFIQGILEEQPEIGNYIVKRLMAGPYSKLKRLYRGANTYGHFTQLWNPGIQIKNMDTSLITNGIRIHLENNSAPGTIIEVISGEYGEIELTFYALKYLKESPYTDALQYDFYPEYDESTSVIHYDFTDENDVALHPPVSIPVPPLDLTSEFLVGIYNKHTQGSSEVVNILPNPPGNSGEYVHDPLITDITETESHDATTVTVVVEGTSIDISFDAGDTVLGQVQPTKGFYSLSIKYTNVYENDALDVTDPPVRGNPVSYLVETYNAIFKKSFETHPFETLIYKKGTGISYLDGIIDAAIVQPSSTFEHYYPPIPLRIDHQLLSSISPPWWRVCKRVAKRNDFKLDKILKTLQDEESWDEMSYVFITFGVGINGHKKDRKDFAKYLWHFFSMFAQNTNPNLQANIEQYEIDVENYHAAMEIYDNDPDAWEGPLPVAPPPVSLGNSIKFNFYARDYYFGFRNEYSISNISYSTGTGLYNGVLQPGFYRVSPGDFYNPPPIPFRFPGTNVIIKLPPGFLFTPRGAFIIVHQKDENEWEAMRIIGAELKVRILGEYSLVTTGSSGGGQPTSNMGNFSSIPGDSDFHIPLLPSVLRKCGIVSATQIATECAWIHVNIYKKVKKKRGWIKWIGFVIAIVVSIYCQACGAQLFTVAAGAGVAMTILVAVANVIVASLIMWALKVIVVKVFGEKWGTLIAIVAAVVLQNWSQNGFQSIDFTSLASASNLISMGTQVVGGYGQHYQAKNIELQKQMEEYSRDMKEKWDEINAQLYTNTGTLDPVMLLNVIRRALDTETPQQFLDRTMWTGSEISEMTMSAISNYAETQLALAASM